MASPTPNQERPHWLARYELRIDPQRHPLLYGRLCRKDGFAEAFADNLERLAGEYIDALESHFAAEAEDGRQAENAGGVESVAQGADEADAPR